MPNSIFFKGKSPSEIFKSIPTKSNAQCLVEDFDESSSLDSKGSHESDDCMSE